MPIRGQPFEPPPFLDPRFELDRFEPAALDRLVEEVRLDAAAARCVDLPELFLLLFAEERDFVAAPRAEERDAVFDERVLVRPAFDAVFFAAVFLAPVFLAPVFFAAVFFAVVFFAAVFFAVVFFAAVFLAAVFFAPDFVLLALDFLVAERVPVFAAAFFAAGFLAPERADDLAELFRLDEPREPLFFVELDEVPPVAPALPILVSLGFDLSSVGMNASFKGLRVHRHACKRQRRYIKRVPINGKCRK